MKKLLLLVPFIIAAQQAVAVDLEAQNNYKKHYIEQIKPLVIKKLAHDKPDLQGTTIKREADAYAAKMAECQLEGLSLFPKAYQDKAILPVANGESVAATTVSLNELLKQDIDAGKLNKDEVSAMIQNAQQTVQICINS